jgi:hypothetical protein
MIPIACLFKDLYNDRWGNPRYPAPGGSVCLCRAIAPASRSPAKRLVPYHPDR